jgi:hypothetical protein
VDRARDRRRARTRLGVPPHRPPRLARCRRHGDRGRPLLGDAAHRGYFYRDDIPVAATITVLGLALLVGLTRDRRRQLPRAALLAAPATVGAVLLVSAPDLIEQLVFVGLLI